MTGETGVLNRRRVLRYGAAAMAIAPMRQVAWALGLSPDTPVCNTAAEQEVGPYYVSDEMIRSDVREDKPGLPLTLRLVVLDSRTCKPLQGAAIDLWHCDALGLYAGFTKMDPRGPGGPPPGPPPSGDPQHPDPQHPENRLGPPEGLHGPPPMHPTDKLTFLRGIQFTQADGRVEFRTVFPGFYMGRTNHIHFKVREDGRTIARPATFGGMGHTYAAGHTAHVGQVFFPEAMTAELMRHEPYARHRIHRTTQAEDGVFEDQHGEASIARLTPMEARRPEAGYLAELIVSVDPTAAPQPVGMRRGGPPPGGPPRR